MCGITGYIGVKEARPFLIEGLRRLEYRGYDSAGIAVRVGSEVQVVKAAGKVAVLADRTKTMPAGHAGIGHTRWATHGGVSDLNAHPHAFGRVTLVHNGIIENYAALAGELAVKGKTPRTQTDTEIAAMVIDDEYERDAVPAIQRAIGRMQGAFAFVILFDDQPDAVYAVRRGSPLVAVQAEDGCYLASDMTALIDISRDYIVPQENVVMTLTRNGYTLVEGDRFVQPNILHADWDVTAAQKGGYPHFMLKEIHEQPAALRNTISPRLREGKVDFSVDGIPDSLFEGLHDITVTACGTAMHAGLVAKSLFEKLSGLPTTVDVASEFRYRDPLVGPGSLVILISQSGETADTLAALRLAREKGASTLAVVNVKGSTIAREAEYVLYTHAGPEIAVASTKAFTVQIAALMLVATKIGLLRGRMDEAAAEGLMADLQAAVEDAKIVLEREAAAEDAAAFIKSAEDMFFIGRGIDVAMAQEGSLKLKEISYIHSEAYAAGELKHGTISLIIPGVPTVALATQADVYPKIQSNIREVHARGGEVILLTHDGWPVEEEFCSRILRVPGKGGLMSVFPTAVMLQLLAYHTSVLRGLPVDQPRNLAKSVTVE